jgi:hypothetical protein
MSHTIPIPLQTVTRRHASHPAHETVVGPYPTSSPMVDEQRGQANELNSLTPDDSLLGKLTPFCDWRQTRDALAVNPTARQQERLFNLKHSAVATERIRIPDSDVSDWASLNPFSRIPTSAARFLIYTSQRSRYTVTQSVTSYSHADNQASVIMPGIRNHANSYTLLFTRNIIL